MPQIWVSDAELGAMFGCPAVQARARTLVAGWPRRRCRDGVTRSKLPQEAFDGFLLDRAARLVVEATLDECVANLRGVLAEAAAPPPRAIGASATRAA